MYPTIGEGVWALQTYTLMGFIGVLVAIFLAANEADRQRLGGRHMIDLCLLLVVTGIVGSRVFHVLFDGFLQDYIHLCTDPEALGRNLPDGSPCTVDDQCIAAQNAGQDIGAVCNTESGHCVPEQDCLRVLKFWSGGLTWYGGFIFAFATAMVFARVRKWSVLRTLDILMPTVAIGHGLGRIGCYLGGCCYGGVCEQPWGVHFPLGSEAYRDHAESDPGALVEHHADTGIWESLAVHPTQLYEAGSLFLIFVLLWYGLRTRKQFHGQVAGWFLVLYAIARFTVEFWRADARGALLGVSTSQWISLLLLPLGAVILWRGYRRLLEASPPRFQGGIPVEVADLGPVEPDPDASSEDHDDRDEKSGD